MGGAPSGATGAGPWQNQEGLGSLGVPQAYHADPQGLPVLRLSPGQVPSRQALSPLRGQLTSPSLYQPHWFVWEGARWGTRPWTPRA